MKKKLEFKKKNNLPIKYSQSGISGSFLKNIITYSKIKYMVKIYAS